MDDNSLVFLLTLTFFVIFPSSLGVLYYVRTYSSFWVTGYCASTEVVKVKGKEPAEDSTIRNPNGPSNEHPKYGLVNDRSPNNDRIKALEEYVNFSNRRHNEQFEELKTQQEVSTKEVEDLKQQLKVAIRTIKALEERLIEGGKSGQSNSRKERREGRIPEGPMN
jgi:hypothetical protein